MSEPKAATKPHLEYENVLSGSATAVAQFDTNDKTPLQKFQHFLHSSPAAVPLIVLILSLIAFGVILGGKFFSPFALTLILQQVAITGIIGAAQTLIILTAGIDLSVGAIMVLSSVVMGQFAVHYGVPGPLAVLCGFAVGGICGFINGVLVARVKLPPSLSHSACGRSCWQPISCIPATRQSARKTWAPMRPSCNILAKALSWAAPS